MRRFLYLTIGLIDQNPTLMLKQHIVLHFCFDGGNLKQRVFLQIRTMLHSWILF